MHDEGLEAGYEKHVVAVTAPRHRVRWPISQNVRRTELSIKLGLDGARVGDEHPGAAQPELINWR